MNKKLDIKEVLNNIDNNNVFYYKNLSEEERKSISPWVLMRYISSSSKYPEHYICYVNELVNKDFSSISKHQELQWMLLCMCGIGKKEFHPWIAPPKGIKKDKIEEFITKIYPHMKKQDIEIYKSINTVEDLILLAKNHGFSDQEITDIFGK